MVWLVDEQLNNTQPEITLPTQPVHIHLPHLLWGSATEPGVHAYHPITPLRFTHPVSTCKHVRRGIPGSSFISQLNVSDLWRICIVFLTKAYWKGWALSSAFNASIKIHNRYHSTWVQFLTLVLASDFWLPQTLRVAGSLPPTWTEFQAPGFSLASTLDAVDISGMIQQVGALCLSLHHSLANRH